MKHKVVVKIFLPNTRTSASSNSVEYLYGEIKCDYEYERECRQVLIFITSRRTERTNRQSARTKLIGEINAKQHTINQKDIAKDYVWLENNFDKSDAMRLKSICLPVSVPDPDRQYKVQIILYEPNTFLKLSKDEDGMPQNTAVLDPIAHLIELLRHKETSHTIQETWCRRIQHFLLLILITVNRLLMKKLLRRESAFLRHLSIWLNSIQLFTFKRCESECFAGFKIIICSDFTHSGRAWTIVFDVTFGMILMLILLRISDPGEYLMKFTEV